MLNKKPLAVLLLLSFLISGCELLRAAQSKDIDINDVSAMFDEGRPSSQGQPVTLTGQMHKFDDWFKENLW